LLGCRAGCLHDQYGCIATALPGKAPDRACLVAGGRSPVCGRTPSRDGSVAQTNSVHVTGTGEGDGCRTQRSLWLSLAKLSDREKAPLLDAPVSVQGAFGEAVVTMAAKFEEQQKSR